jgi:hypothetical protein
MNPSINHRLDSMMRAVTEIILPALGSSNSLATEQAGLLLGHMSVLRMQIDNAPRYLGVEMQAAKTLGRALVAEASGGTETKASVATLTAALEERGTNGPAQADDRLERINEAIENLVYAMKEDGDAESRACVSKLILEHGKAAAERDRVWFSAMGFEAADSALPSFSDLLVSMPEIVLAV